MSKSLSQIILPVTGGVALALAGGTYFANLDYGQTKIASLETRVVQVSEQVEAANTKAATEAERAKALESEIAKVRSMAETASNAAVSEPVPVELAKFNLGRAAHGDEIAAWDIDVLPDGRGLPEGRGDAFTGEEVFATHCASCHGDFAEGVDNWPVLAGGFDTLADEDPVKTVGSYWPYLSTVWDYVNRSMPFGNAQSLTNDEVYAIVAYILYSNDMVDEEFELSHENFTNVKMHNTAGFVIDDRAEKEYAVWRGEPCMENCKENVEITMRASVLNVTPEDETNDASMKTTSGSEDATKTEEAPEAMEPKAAEEEEAAAGTMELDATLVAAGEKVFKKCKACHQVGEGAKNKSGPQLNGIFGRTFGSVDGFKYSKVFKEAKDAGRKWDAAELDAFLLKPKAHMKRTKMAFSGLKKEADRTAIIEYLKAQGQ